MINLFNVLASTFRFREPHAKEELGELLNILGDSCAEMCPTAISGLLIGRTRLDPLLDPENAGRSAKEGTVEIQIFIESTSN